MKIQQLIDCEIKTTKFDPSKDTRVVLSLRGKQLSHYELSKAETLDLARSLLDIVANLEATGL
ncbi:hypothetical protein LCGC14_0755150 [marine sediment metagenome]|uniref:Uncharacterized protein n=1 Tax=marine sediment metagenome TaxID=412755 RepID=A0A0F9SN21_9ZZZZ